MSDLAPESVEKEDCRGYKDPVLVETFREGCSCLEATVDNASPPYLCDQPTAAEWTDRYGSHTTQNYMEKDGNLFRGKQ